MRLATEANRIGSERYDALVAILNAEPETQADLAMMAKAALSDEMWLGPMTWAGEKLARATIAFNERVLEPAASAVSGLVAADFAPVRHLHSDVMGLGAWKSTTRPSHSPCRSRCGSDWRVRSWPACGPHS